MRKIFVAFLIFNLPLVLLAQYNLEYGVESGGSNYLGEIGGKDETRRAFVSDMKISQTRFASGTFARYRIIPKLYAKASLTWVRISGADSLSTNPGRVGRNLSFRNDIYEMALTAQYVIYEVPDLGRTMQFRNDMRIYAFAGIGSIYNNPKAEYNGTFVPLQPLKTEGVNYGKINVSFPLGVGLYVTLNKIHRIGWELNYRFTLTDYLDDISTTYVDPSTLSSEEAKALANRRDELGNVEGIPDPRNYIAGNKRGDPSHKDGFGTTTISYSYVLRGKSSFYRSRYGSVFKGNTGKKRKVRAKF